MDLWRKFHKIGVRVSLDAYPAIYDYVRVRGNLSVAEENIKLANQLPNMNLSSTLTTNLLNITRIVDIAKYYYSLHTQFHTSLVQFPRNLNVKLLPNELKEKVTAEWQEFRSDSSWMSPYKPEFNENFEKRLKLFGDNVINYMNGEDWHEHWHEFVSYTNAQDRYHKTDILDYYPEYEKYWK